MNERDRVRPRPLPSPGEGQRNPAPQERVDPAVWQGATARPVSGPAASPGRPDNLRAPRSGRMPVLPAGRGAENARGQTRPAPAPSAPAVRPPEAPREEPRAPRLDGKRDLSKTVTVKGKAIPLLGVRTDQKAAPPARSKGRGIIEDGDFGQPRGFSLGQSVLPTTDEIGQPRGFSLGQSVLPTPDEIGLQDTIEALWNAPAANGSNQATWATRGPVEYLATAPAADGWSRASWSRPGPVEHLATAPAADGWNHAAWTRPGPVETLFTAPAADGSTRAAIFRLGPLNLPFYLRRTEAAEKKTPATLFDVILGVALYQLEKRKQKAPPTPPPAKVENPQPYPSIRATSGATATEPPASERVYPSVQASLAPTGWRTRLDTASGGVTRSAHLEPPAAEAYGGEEPPQDQRPSSRSTGASYDDAFVMGSLNKSPTLDAVQQRGEDEVSSERVPPSPWYGALGYAMQHTIVDAILGTQIAADYIAGNGPLQALGAQLDPLHAENPFEHPNMQDIVDVMKFAARHIARFYDRQRRELGFDDMMPFHEVGLLHNYKQFNESRERINILLQAGELTPQEIAFLTDPRSQIAEDRWSSIADRQLRQDLQIVTQPSSLYVDTDNGQTHYYIAPDGVRPDMIRVLTNKAPEDDDMPYLIAALGHIIKGPKKRRNIQDFSRWVKDPVPYVGGTEITALEALDRFCQRVAAGDAYVLIDEVKTRPNNFSRYHTEIDFALGYTPGPANSIIDTNMGADISGTTQAVVHLLQNALGYTPQQLFKMDPYWQTEFTEISFNMLHPDTPDTVHASAADIVIPVPRFRVYSVGLRDLYHGWKKRESRIKDRGRIDRVRSERNGPVTILPDIP